MIGSIKSLYAPDARTGDALLKPHRWCYSNWVKLVQPIQISPGALVSLAGRIIVAAALAIATLGCCALGIVGIGLKACQRIPEVKSRGSVAGDEDEHLSRDSSSASDTYREEELLIFASSAAAAGTLYVDPYCGVDPYITPNAAGQHATISGRGTTTYADASALPRNGKLTSDELERPVLVQGCQLFSALNNRMDPTIREFLKGKGLINPRSEFCHLNVRQVKEGTSFYLKIKVTFENLHRVGSTTHTFLIPTKTQNSATGDTGSFDLSKIMQEFKKAIFKHV